MYLNLFYPRSYLNLFHTQSFEAIDSRYLERLVKRNTEECLVREQSDCNILERRKVNEIVNGYQMGPGHVLRILGYKVVRHRFYTSAGNHVKEILLKLNLPDHRILKDGGEVLKITSPLTSKDKGTSSSLKSKITTTYLQGKIKKSSLRDED
ncbi:hypothetical protein Tco_0098666 [Tanacetum coccineum]